MGRLDNKVAMVTGAGGEHGLGRAIARRFAEEGADLVLTDVIPTGLRVSSALKPGAWGGIEAVADEIRKRGRRVITEIADVRSAAEMAKVVSRALEEFGRIDILGFTQSLAQELASAGITVNAICPSAAETERLDHMGLRADGSFDAQQRAERIKQTAAATPLGRIARPSDVAEVAAFLAGDAAEYITGQSINVTGGGVMH